jgi:uroporphyrinogen decarboxylase
LQPSGRGNTIRSFLSGPVAGCGLAAAEGQQANYDTCEVPVNARERFRRIMNFESVDRLPLMEIEGYEQPTIERWRSEGLPADQSPDQALEMDGITWLPVGFAPVPEFEQRVVEENDEYVIEINAMGITTKRVKGRQQHTYEGYVDFPVKNLHDWREYAKRLDGKTPERYGSQWGPDLWQSLNDCDRPVGLLIHPFCFRMGLFTMGLENFLVAFYEQPDLLHAMFDHCATMALDVIKEVSAHVTIDYACIAEDMAFRSGPHISPEMYREFWWPHQPPVMDALKAAGVDVIAMWSSGDLRPILPTLIEAGFNTTWPVEDFVGMNVAELRKEYGNSMRFVGNIPIRAVADGKDAIDRQIEEKVVPLMAEGGYIPTIDDQTPPEVSWENYCYYINRLREL